MARFRHAPFLPFREAGVAFMAVHWPVSDCGKTSAFALFAQLVELADQLVRGFVEFGQKQIG